MNADRLPASASAPKFAFAGAGLNRASDKREDAVFLAGLRARADARVLLIGRDMPIFRAAEHGLEPFFSFAEAQSLGPTLLEALLGLGVDEAPVFAALLPDAAIELLSDSTQGFLDGRRLHIPGRDDLKLVDLRSIALRGDLPPATVAQIGEAKALLSWHARHGHCANCGALTRVAAAGWRRECDACKTHHFPRTDPVVIMLAVDGQRCLLGRQARFPAKMYSCLAGFLEPGETIEEAVRREIAEEAGIACGEVNYVASQPWPFPASLMIGCLTQALSEKITIDGVELEDARWFSRAECRLMLADAHPDGLTAPAPLAIAHHIIRTWVEG